MAEQTAQTREAKFSLRITPIAQVLILGLLIRLILASLPGFNIDINAFHAWSLQLADQDPWNFYQEGFFADYAPGYLYVLLLFGGANLVFDFEPERFEYVLKLPSIVADLAGAYLLYKLLEGQKEQWRVGAAVVYLLHPATLLIGPVWGQVDSILSFFILLTVYYLVKGQLAPASVAYVVGFLVKPQALAMLPLFIYWALRDHGPREWLRAAALSLAVGLILIIPFFPDNPFDLVDVLRESSEVYPYTSFWAFNFWALFDRFKSDNITLWGITYHDWGIVLFLIASIGIILAFQRSRSPGMMALAASHSVLAFYLFLTRMHERYLFPALLPLLAAAVLLKSRLLAVAFAVLSVIHFFNLYEVYLYYNRYFNRPDLKPEPLFRMIAEQTFLLSLIATLAFPALIAVAYIYARREVAAK